MTNNTNTIINALREMHRDKNIVHCNVSNTVSNLSQEQLESFTDEVREGVTYKENIDLNIKHGENLDQYISRLKSCLPVRDSYKVRLFI